MSQTQKSDRLPVRPVVIHIPPPPSPQPPNLLLGSLHWSDDGNAKRLLLLSGQDLRFVKSRKKWLIWDGRRWLWDERGEAYEMAKRAMRMYVAQAAASTDGAELDFAVHSRNANQLRALLEIAATDPDIAIKPEDLDRDPWLLCCKNGTLNLKTGQLRPHSRGDLITRLVHVDYLPNARGPRWEAFFKQVVDPSLRKFVKSAIGYALVGVTTEKLVFVFFGEPNSGKTTLLNAVRKVIAEYSTQIMPATLMRMSQANGPQADLSDLNGARFVTTSEWERGQSLSQAMLKRITQGQDAIIKARRLYENPVRFTETHCLFIDTNPKPTIRDVTDAATFNRLAAVPFRQTVPPNKIDKTLHAALATEAEQEGILAFAVRGVAMWLRGGLERPPLVQQAVEEWREENDTVGTFIRKTCIVGRGHRTLASVLYGAYADWCSQTKKDNVVSIAEFSRKLLAFGFKKRHSKAGEMYLGVSAGREDSEGDEGPAKTKR